VNKALELAREQKVIGKPLDAEITLYIGESAAGAFEELVGLDLKTLFIVSAVEIEYGCGAGYEGIEFQGVAVSVIASEKPKCARCWIHDKDVGNSPAHPELCPRCLDAVTTGGY